MTLWNRRGDGEVERDVLAFSAGNEFLLDDRLVMYDCGASIAHAAMLGRIGVLTDEEVESAVKGLLRIRDLAAEGEFEIEEEQEDCHTAIEEWLTENVGEVGKKIHLGRSRNDQVLTALRLFERDALGAVGELVVGLQEALQQAVKTHGEIEMPGYTHMRRAMPTTVGTWLSAFANALADDLLLVGTAGELIDRSPLGTGAGYGIPVFDLDREMTAEALDFAYVLENPIHAQMSRGKLEAAVVGALAQIMLTLNRLASDVLLFSTKEFGFVTLPRELCTGSSIMPQKHNPDVLELVRAKLHTVQAAENEIQGLVSNLTSGYQRDLGLTKEPLFRAFDTTMECLHVMTTVVSNVGVDEEACAAAMTDELHATREAYELVKQGMPFRDAYRQVADKYADPKTS